MTTVTDNAQANAKLFTKIAAVMGSARKLAKDGHNKYDNYDYVTADKIATHIGSELAAQGVAFLPSVISSELLDYQTKNGSISTRCIVRMQMTFACTETGATWTSNWDGEAIDRSDKSMNKAIVSAVKYFLNKTFLLAGGKEDDADAESPTVEREPQAKAKTANVARATKAQVKLLNEVGTELYKDKWEEASVKWVEWATDQKETLVENLDADQIATVIDHIETRIQKAIADQKADAGTPAKKKAA